MKHIIWSNMNLDLDDWRDDILAEHPDYDEDECCELMYRINDDYLDDERVNLSIQFDNPILVIADIGRWDGRYSGYKEIDSGNVADCLYTDCGFAEWYIEDGDMRGIGIHHDGRNYMRYRVWKPYVDHDELLDKLYEGTATEEDIQKYTESIAPYVCNVYGWEVA